MPAAVSVPALRRRVRCLILAQAPDITRKTGNPENAITAKGNRNETQPPQSHRAALLVGLALLVSSPIETLTGSESSAPVNRYWNGIRFSSTR